MEGPVVGVSNFVIRGIFLFNHLPTTHYSSLFANNNKTTFSWKNLNFVKHGENTSTDCLSSAAAFTSNMQICSEQQKIPLCFIQRPLHRVKTAQSAEWKTCFAKRQQKCSTIYLCFVAFSSVRPFLRLFVNSVYLATHNLNGSKIYRNLHFCNFWLNKKCKSGDSGRFCYRLGFDWLNKEMPRMTKLDTPTTVLPSLYWHHVGYIHRITAIFIQCGWNTKH